MFSSIKRGARLAAVIGISAAVVVGLAGPASAAPPADQNQGLGIVTTGLIAAGPFAAAQFNQGPFTDTLINVDVPTLLSSATVNAAAGEDSASASVEDLSVDLNALASLTASAVSSECSYDGVSGALTGSASLADAQVEILSDLPIPLPPIVIDLDVTPAPNTGVSVPGIATITLNRQVTNPDGSLTVDAIFIDLLSGTQTITIATSSCQPEVLVIPVIAPAFAIGAGVFGLLGFGFFIYRRQQNSAPAAA